MLGQARERLLKEAMGILVARFGKQHQSNFKEFLLHLYEHLPDEDISKLRVSEISEGLINLWELMLKRSRGKPQFDVYYWKPKGSSLLSERIIIDVINDDMSFLVDSLLGFLAISGLKPRLVMHPVYEVERSKDGTLKKILKSNGRESGPNHESIIHCEIVEGASPEFVDFIKEKIPEIFEDVALATQDWQSMRSRIDVAMKDLQSSLSVTQSGQLEENIEFLEWIRNEHFTFLGYCNYDLVTPSGKLLREPNTSGGLGILRKKELHKLSYLYEGITFNSLARRYIHEPVPVSINKTTQISNVHRPVVMDCLWVKRFNERGQVIGIHLFVGLFTSVAYDSSARDIPLLKKKIYKILEQSNLSSHWHDGKSLIHILDSLPRDELFQASVPELSKIALAVLRLQHRHKVALFVRRDQFNRFLSCLVYVPRDRFDSALCDTIGEILAHEFKGSVSAYKAQFGALDFARIHYTVMVSEGIKDSYDFEAIEKKLITSARLWKDDLRVILNETFGELESARYYKRYKDAFGRGYQERFRGDHVLKDIIEVEKVLKTKKRTVRIDVETQENDKSVLKLKIYNYGSPLPLSDVLPSLENMDLRVISEIPFKVNIGDQQKTVWIHDFEAISRTNYPLDIIENGQEFLEALHKLWDDEIENDEFNRLIFKASLTWRQCLLLRAYCKYLRQIQIPFTNTYIQNTLVSNPSITSLIVKLFEKKFDPKIAKTDQTIINKIEQALKDIASPDEDRILRSYLNLVLATVRTNFYQKSAGGEFKPYISFKFECALIEDLPLPKPMYEIFVHSRRFEAVHLRGGKVARGGIRWSDRLEDFRTEILGLLKAQMVKNTVIIPVGSKGGFVVKKDLKESSREEIQKEGVECYQMMMRGLLDITDNLVSAKVVHPKDVVCWDEEDPYLVVAADKGTATFSDYANSVSKDYKLWLDDAFASGGSVGYDHKKMAITARGAWESVKRHFREKGMDISKTVINVVGVGDMAGDVFGNGMLLSDHLRLVAVFNHMHIFVDPDPDPLLSFKERKRLFNLPRSTWLDYDRKVLSKGGGIFERNAKEIQLTPEIKALFGLAVDKISPNKLIQEILKHPADLMWLGGIGTFVKSSRESHADVGDRTNDVIRVNAKDLRCKVVGEGANLGFTQLGRIEFANQGGYINTDAIDNSAGVDCSDHEVNIKILLNSIMKKNILDQEGRKQLLEEMTDEVASLVLKDNYLQTLAISITQQRGTHSLDQQIKLMNLLEKKGKLNRALEFLPDDAMIQEYQASQKNFSRPELAILMAYSKIFAYDQILESKLPEDSYFELPLINYFPRKLRQNYREFILKHPLRREIIATHITNEIINRLGPTFISDAQEKSGCLFEDVVRACFVVISVFDLESFWYEIESLDNIVNAQAQLQVFLDILKVVKRITLWLLKYYPNIEGISETSSALRMGVEAFLSGLAGSLDDEGYQSLAHDITTYTEMGFNKDLAQHLALLKIAATSPDIILIASETHHTVPEVASLYFLVGERFGFNILRHAIDQLALNSFWHRWAAASLQEDLYMYQTNLVTSVLTLSKKTKTAYKNKGLNLLGEWTSSYKKDVERVEQVLAEAKIHGLNDLAMVTVVARELRQLCGA